MIPLTLIGGYLGSGKTTLVNHILRQNHGKRFALLINDFGDINIDASLIESKTENQINLTNGCVCCTISEGFQAALEQLIECVPYPEHIILEASGVASMTKLVQQCQGPNLCIAGKIVVADAETVRLKAEDKFVSGTVRQQLLSADLILLNKIDLVQTDSQDELTAWIKNLAPKAQLLPSLKCKVPIEILLHDFSKDQKKTLLDNRSIEHDDHKSISHVSNFLISEETTTQFLSQVPAEVIRGKGIVALKSGGSMLIQIVGKRQEITHVHWQADPKIQFVALGASLAWPEDEIRSWLKNLD